MGKKLKFFGIVTSIIIAMSLGIIYGQFLEKNTAEKLTNEILDSKNKILLSGRGKIGCGENYSGGGGTYKINEKGEIEFVKGVEYGQPAKDPCDGRENCFIITMTENDTRPKAASGKDWGYRTGKIPKIFKTSNTTAFNAN